MSPLREIPMIEQIVPSTICFACDVCCRFPDDTSPLRPYFTEEEIRAAMAAGVAPDAFPDHHGSQVRLVPHDEGYRCPAFCPETGHCGIYTARPLDCRLYPIAVMWDVETQAVVMGWDSKCPFIRGTRESPESQMYVDRMAARLESPNIADIFIEHPQLVGAYQDDVIILKRLDTITLGLRPSEKRRRP